MASVLRRVLGLNQQFKPGFESKEEHDKTAKADVPLFLRAVLREGYFKVTATDSTEGSRATFSNIIYDAVSTLIEELLETEPQKLERHFFEQTKAGRALAERRLQQQQQQDQEQPSSSTPTSSLSGSSSVGVSAPLAGTASTARFACDSPIGARWRGAAMSQMASIPSYTTSPGTEFLTRLPVQR